jgi:PhnB protein
MSFNPYLFFSGDCAEAFERYHEIFGGDLQIMRHGDLPDDAEPMPGASPHHVMLAAVTADDGVLLGSDDPTGDGGPKVGLAVSWTGADDAATKATFDQLADGGEVQMPLSPTFWTSSFGVCVDRFGISWMVGTQSES